MKLPRSFNFGPHEITVRVVSKAEMAEVAKEHEDVPLGMWDRDALTVYVQRARKGFPKTAQLQTFWHEFTHALFETLGYDKLSANEQLVDQCGLLMLQAQQTFKY